MSDVPHIYYAQYKFHPDDPMYAYATTSAIDLMRFLSGRVENYIVFKYSDSGCKVIEM